jgi:co-chaperonin GroES (HSP10)
MNSENVTPRNTNVLVEIVEQSVENDGVYIGPAAVSGQIEQHYYRGIALKLGPDADSAEKEQCPGLEVGDKVIFSDLAGYPVATEDKYCKVITGHSIVAKTTDFDNMNAETLKATGKRVLVEVLKEDLVVDGIYNSSASDPRKKATQLGKILHCAELADQYPIGTVIAFEPYVGNPLQVGDTFYKTINSTDIEFTIES